MTPRLAVMLLLTVACSRADRNVVRVGSKNFTESIILGEIVAQTIEAAGITVERKLNLGGTFINHEAMVAGQLDVYVEYTGTAYSAVLQLPVVSDRSVVRAAVDSAYAVNWDLVWGQPFGFDNTFALLIRGEDARRLGVRKVSDIVGYAPQWTAGFGHEFLNRADGYDGLVEHYGLHFADSPVSMDLGLIYRAVAEGRIDVTAGNSTDGQIRALDLYHLEDDRDYFPPYEAVPLVRSATLRRWPRLAEILGELGGTITEEAMTEMNFLVDVERIRPAVVARNFLAEMTVPAVLSTPQ